jgi:hypothetical protein
MDDFFLIYMFKKNIPSKLWMNVCFYHYIIIDFFP